MQQLILGGAIAALLYKNAFRQRTAEEIDNRNCEYEPCEKGESKEVP